MNITFSLGAQVIRGFTQAEDFNYSIVETPLVVGGTAADSSFYDATNTLTTSSGIENNFQIQVGDSFLLPGHHFVNQAPAVASIDADGNVAMITPGAFAVDIVTPVGKRQFGRIMSNTGTTALSFKQYKTGSLGAAVVSAINSMISGKTPGIGTQQFITSNNFNTSTPAVVRNSNLFTSAYDATAISVMRSDRTDAAFPVLLVSPRHAMCASHIQPAVGTTITWLDSTGAYHQANVLSSSGYDTTYDICVLYLSAAIPAAITPFSFLPTAWENYLQSQVDSSSNVQHMPCLDRLYHPDDVDSYFSAMCVVEMQFMATVNSGSHVTVTYAAWTDGTTGVRGGDSGSPIMLPINGKLVLVSAHWTASGGTNWVAHNTWIESQMNSLATAQGDNTVYSMLRIDLSSFTQFTTI